MGMSTDREWHSLRLHLESLKNSVAEEIRNYPPPIPGCDVQFNHLTEQRRLLSLELARLECAARDRTGVVADFIDFSPLKDELSAFVLES